jgi:6-phosphogluconolactonase (cycloisomerase 2 family)
VPGSIIPDTNIAYDLGNATKRFRDIYLSSNTINLGGAAVSVNGSGQLLVNGNNAATTFEYFGGEGYGPTDAASIAWETATGVSTIRANLPGALLKLALYELKVGDKIKISNVPDPAYFEIILTVSRVAYDIQIGGNPQIILGVAESTPSIRFAYQLYLPVRNRTTSIINRDKIVALSTSGILTVPGSIIPDTNIAYDLGSATNRFRDLYLSTNTIYLGNNLLSFDSSGQLATAQSYTGGEGVGGIYSISWDTGFVLRSTTSLTGTFVAIFESLKTGDKFNISIYQNGRFETVVLTVTGTVQRSGPNPNYDFTIPVDISPPSSTIVVESFNITKVPTSNNAVQNTATSTSTNTGALTVAGGVGIGGRLYVGDMINAGQTVRTDRFIQSPYQLIAPRGVVYRGTGALSTITTAIATLGPIDIAVDPTGRFAYVLNLDNDTISQYSINANTGVLTPITPATTTTGRTPFSIAIDPTGRFAYVANKNNNTIGQYIINQSTGALSTTTNAIASGLDPESVVVDATGRFVYVANRVNGAIGQYSINASTGALTLIGTISVGAFPYSLSTDPTGRFVYAINNNSTIGQYSITANTGALTLIGTIAIGAISAAMVTDPTGRFVYVTNQAGANTVKQYSINQNTGELTLVGTVATGSSPENIAIDPTGRFVYVANNGAGTVSQYLINQNTGVLSTITNAIAASGDPKAVAIDPTGRFVYVTNWSTGAVDQYTINNFGAGSSVIAGKLFIRGLSNNISSYIVYINTSTGELSYGVNSGSVGSVGSPYSGIFTSTNTSSAVSTTTGALQVAGGVGIGGGVYVGGTVTATTFTGLASAGTTATTSAALGYLGMPQNSTAFNYTLVAGDQGKHIYVTSSTTITIPANTVTNFPIGSSVTIIAAGVSTSTVAIQTDTMYLGGIGTTGTRTLAAYGVATLVKVTTTTWFINGSGLT